MADGNFTVASSTPEIFTRVRGEISDSRGDVSLIRATGEEVPAIKGTKIYLNDTLSSREDSAVIAYFGDSGVLVLGQNQQAALASDFFNNVDSLEQVGSANTGALNTSRQPDAGIDLAALEQAIQAGQNIEELLEPTAAGGDATNESGASSSVVFYQRTGDSLIAVSGFETSTVDRAQINPINEINDIGDLDSNNQINVASDDGSVSDGPEITLDDSLIPPPSSGLVLNFYNNLNNANRTAADQEAFIESVGNPAAPIVSREINGFGTDDDVTNFNTFLGDGSTIQIDTSDSYSVSGLIYLEAGSTYQFSGYHDDSLRIELGGQTMVSTTGDSWGNYGPADAPRDNVRGDALVAPVSGYYTFEAYVNNVSGPGQFSLNLFVDGTSHPLDTNNFNIYTGVDDLLTAGGQIGAFTPSTDNIDGGYFPQQINTGTSSHYIEISNITTALIDTDGSETITAIEIRAIPIGATLTDGLNSFTATAGNTTLDLLTNSWGLDNIQILSAPGFVGEINLTIAATSTESSNGDSLTATEPLTVTVLDASAIDNGIDDDISSPVGLGNDDFIIGSSADDNGAIGLGTLSGGDGNDAIHGGSGNDRLEGDDGNDLLAGEAGADFLDGGTGEDIILGGAGDDNMTGGAGSDTFTFKTEDADGSTDTIADFTLSVVNADGTIADQGDVLNFADLLEGEDTGLLTDYLSVSCDIATGASTIIVNADGVGGDTDVTIVLQGVDLCALGVNQAAILQSLIDSNNLTVDP
jgi:Ca2+-binding RTX toxin-like protein